MGAVDKDARRAERMLSIEVSSRLSVERLFRIRGIHRLSGPEGKSEVKRPRNQAVSLARQWPKLSQNVRGCAGFSSEQVV